METNANGRHTGIAYDIQLWTQCLRVLKPGAHLLAFGGTRTYHRMACAIEDAGFEIRDSIHWLYGSGFPKSMDVSKAIDKAAGVKRTQVIGWTNKGMPPGANKEVGHGEGSEPTPITAPATDVAREWEGWGTALKPAHEPIVMARKPLVGTVAATVLEHGTGALNIDGARVPGAIKGDPNRFAKTDGGSFNAFTTPPVVRSAGRWPANVITDGSIDAEWVRYFYCAKPSKAERNAGLDALPVRNKSENRNYANASRGRCQPCERWADVGEGDNCFQCGTAFERQSNAQRPMPNNHPTVKPLDLMRYLVRLVTPPGGTVLEPFAGSGTTLAAAIIEGFNAIGCELTADYLPIIEGRIAWAQQQTEPDQESLFNQ